MTDDARFNELFNLTSIISLVFQISATALIAVLSYVVSQAVRRRQMLYWAGGWACYAGALIAVMFTSRLGAIAAPVLLFAYYFLEYVAVMFIFAGCRYTATDEPPRRAMWWLTAPAALIAVILVASGIPFFWAFAAHTTIVGLAWAACLFGLWPALRRGDGGAGVRIVAVGLVLLSIDYLHHLPVGLYLAAHHITQSPYYYTVISLFDGMFEFVLGFGTVVVIVDKVRADLEAANEHLRLAHDRTREALHTDPLTAVRNRYSFADTYSEAKERRARSGCVAVVDLDGLKSVNDTHGHAAGDAAIRAVAGGLRSLIRHEDRVYRWGGDEFVVVLSDMPLDLARRRMHDLDAAIDANLDAAHRALAPLSVSWGVAEFGSDKKIKDAIGLADAAMYLEKLKRRSSGGAHRA